jgi:hypothetical protein
MRNKFRRRVPLAGEILIATLSAGVILFLVICRY